MNKDFFASEIGKCFQALSNTKPGTPDYSCILCSVRELNDMKDVIRSITAELYDEPVAPVELTPLPDPTPGDDNPFVEPEVFKQPEVPKTGTEEEKKYDLSEVRKMLSEVRNTVDDFKIKPWLQERFGVDNATAIPESKFGEVMKELTLILDSNK